MNFQAKKIFYAIYGNTGDIFITPELEKLNLTEWLLKYLKELGFKRIVFYNSNLQIHFYDEASMRLSGVNPPREAARARAGLVSRGNPFMQESNTSEDEDEQRINFPQALRAMNDGTAIESLNTFFRDDDKTAIIFESNLDHIDGDYVRTWDGYFTEWQKKEENSIVIFLLKSHNLDTSRRFTSLRNHFYNTAKVTANIEDSPLLWNDTRNFYIGKPSASEVSNYLHRLRLKKELVWTPKQIEDRALIISQNLIPEEKDKPTGQLKEVILDKYMDSLPESARVQLQNMPGLQKFEEKIDALIAMVKNYIPPQPEFHGYQIERLTSRETIAADINLHIVLTGPPGTGKTTLAQITAKIFKDANILPSGHFVYATPADLIAGYVGQTAIKTQELIQRALGGVLFIDEAYGLASNTNENNNIDYKKEAVDVLLESMSRYNGQFSVILAGYKEDIHQLFQNANDGLARRFPDNNHWHIDKYKGNELYQIFKHLIAKKGLRLSTEFDENKKLENAFNYWQEANATNRKFSNARDVISLVEQIDNSRLRRSGNKIELQDFTGNDWRQYLGTFNIPKFTDLIAPLDELVGLETVKDFLNEKYINIKYLLQHGEGYIRDRSPGHYIFSGNPGTGKTDVANTMASMFYKLGLILKRDLVKIRVSDLCSNANATRMIKEATESARNGLLFIDEAHQLANNPCAIEAFKALIPIMTDEAQSLGIIFAGYPEELNRLKALDPGFSGRTTTINFPDYDAEQLFSIAIRQLEKEAPALCIDEAIRQRLQNELVAYYGNKPAYFSNARFVIKQLVPHILSRYRRRVIAKEVNDYILCEDDLLGIQQIR